VLRHRRGRAPGSLAAVVIAAALAGCTADPPPTTIAVSMSEVAARAAHTSTTLEDGRLFVAGGCVTDGCAVATDDTALVDADGRHAVRGPSLGQPRSSHTSTLLDDGRVLLVGGFLGEGAGVSDAIEVFDPATGRLTHVGSLAQPRGGHAAARLSDGRVLVVGGWIASGRYTDEVEVFDPVSGAVATAERLPWAADALEATPTPDGRVLVTGGQVASGEATASAAVFDEATGSWRVLAPMTSPRLKHFAVLLDDGSVLVGGGTPDDRTLLSSTEVFDPRTHAFAPGPTLREGRYKLPGGAIALPQSRALIAGGGTSAEIVDVAGGTSRLLTTYDERASFATVNLLSNAAVLILGGYDDRIDLTGLDRIVPLPNAHAR